MLDLSDRLELVPLGRVVGSMARVQAQGRLLLVGAAARDIHFTVLNGIPLERATRDVDLAMGVPDWASFLEFREGLLGSGDFFPESKVLHAFRHRDGTLVDLIPFGGVLRPDRTIAWPPDGNPVMTLPCYEEAWATSIQVLLPGSQTIHLVSIPAQALLKLFAWKDRRNISRGKDGQDLWPIMRYYLDTGPMDRLYEEGAHLFGSPDFDLDSAGAWLLGRDSRKVLEHGESPDDLVVEAKQVVHP